MEQSKEDPRLIRMLVSLGVDDFDEEGTWKTTKTNIEIEHIPWAAGRPAVGGVDYGCLTLMMMVSKKIPQQAYLVIVLNFGTRFATALLDTARSAR